MIPLIGKPVSRVDGFAKVTGAAKYAGDYFVDRMAHAVIFESTIAAGAIKSFDLSEAKKVVGLIDIITHENAPDLQVPKLPSGGAGMGEKTIPLHDNEIFYNGQFIGVVVAETLEAAMQAAKLVRVNYKIKEAKTNIDNLKDHAFEAKKIQQYEKISSERGDVGKAYANSAVKIEASYSTPVEFHNPMEPHGTVVHFKSENELVVYDATQGVSSCADILGTAAKVKDTQVIAKYIGGGFGCKGSVWNHQFIALMAAKKTNRPIKLMLTRQQMFTGVGNRASTLQEIKLGCDTNGKLNSIEHVVYNNTAINKDYAETSALATRMLYHCDNVKADHRIVKLNYGVPTFMRAPGESSGSCALEVAMDEMADKLKIDPVEFRIKNYAETDLHSKKPFSSKSLKECYTKGAAHFGWNRRNLQPGTHREGDEWVGYGMATATYPANRFATKVSVDLMRDGRVKVRCATQDLGTGSWTIFTELPAQLLGVPVANIDLDIGDSKLPKGAVSGGSSTASSVGSCIEQACSQIKKQLASIPGGDIKNTQLEKISGEGETKMERGETKTHSTHAFGAHFAEVRVNADTGQVRVMKMTGAFASGRILNEKTARSQYMGGIIFGLGMGLMEEGAADIRTGRLAVRDLAEYHFPTNMDVPQIDVLMIAEEDKEVNSIGTKGIGEIGIVGSAAAIANAVYNACGARVRDYPLTPEKVLAAMKTIQS